MSTPLLRAGRPTLTTLCAAVIGLAACGPQSPGTEGNGPFAGLSGPQIADRAIEASRAASSLTLDMDLRTADGPLRAYLAMDTGGRCAGTISLGATGTAELVRTGEEAYMRFDEAFLREQGGGGTPEETAAVLRTLKGRWVRTDASDPEAGKSLARCDLDKLLAGVETGAGTARRGGETTVGGRKALTLTETDGDASYKVYVATEGEPYLLRIEQKGGEDPGTLSFLDHGKPVPAERPADEDVLDMDVLGRG